MANSTISADGGAMPTLPRRSFITGIATAGICGASTGSAFADRKAEVSATPELMASPELTRMIETYEQVIKEKDALSDRMERVWERADRPQQPCCVRLSEVCAEKRYYQPEHRAKAFTQIADLDRFFDQTKCGWPSMVKVEEQRKADWHKARGILSDRIARFEAWDASAGYTAMDSEYGALYEQKWDLEDNICDFPCRSIGDIITKIAFANTSLPSGEDDDMRQHFKILASMSELAVIR